MVIAILLPWLQAWIGVPVPAKALARRCNLPLASTDVSSQLQQTSYFLSEIAMMSTPVGLEATLRVLQQQGSELIPPTADEDMHPLVLPLAKAADGTVTGLLKWPGDEKAVPPLVSMSATGNQLTLIAPSAQAFVKREIEVADAEGRADADALAELAASAQIERALGDPKRGGLAARVLVRAGPFMAEYETLAANHLAGTSDLSVESALITCERNQACFKAWGRPFIFHSKILSKLGRMEESRDCARHALTLPLWTFGYDLSEVCSLAETDVETLTAQLERRAEGEMSPEQLREGMGIDKRTPQQIAMERASYLLDLVVAAPDRYSWASTRSELRERYTDAGYAALAGFVDPDQTI